MKNYENSRRKVTDMGLPDHNLIYRIRQVLQSIIVVSFLRVVP